MEHKQSTEQYPFGSCGAATSEARGTRLGGTKSGGRR